MFPKICLLFLLSSIPRDDTRDVVVDVVEINHRYLLCEDDVYDQLLLWKYSRKDKKYNLLFRIYMDYAREQLSPEQFREKERKFHTEFLQRRPNYRGRLPIFIPDFIGGPTYPRKNPSNSLYYVLYRRYIYIIKYKTESWTDYDP